LLVWCGRIRGHGGLLGGVAGLPAWYGNLMSSAGPGSRLALLSGAAEVLTTNNCTQDRRHNSPQVSARPAFRWRGCARPARALAGGSWRFRRLTCDGRDMAGAAGAAYCWGQEWFCPVPVAVADRLCVGGLGW